MKDQRLLLLTANQANRRLLEQCLARDYQVVAAAEDNVLDIPFDLGILDAPALTALKRDVQHRRETAAPAFLPFLVFSDMDRFKSVVDTHGHLLGAKVLREAAEVFHRHLGPEDRIVRYGGDEYVIILPGQGKTQALQKIELLRQGLVAESFLKKEKINLHITASLGLATYPTDAKDKRALLAAADTCLFRSKEHGKNRITVFGT